MVTGFLPLTAYAQLLPACNPVPGQPDSCEVADLFALLVNIYNYLLGLAALVAMLFIVWGGMRMFYFGYMEDSASELEAAKFTVRRAIGGFVIIATAYLLVATLLYLLGLDRGTEGGAGFFLRSIGL